MYTVDSGNILSVVFLASDPVLLATKFIFKTTVNLLTMLKRSAQSAAVPSTAESDKIQLTLMNAG